MKSLGQTVSLARFQQFSLFPFHAVRTHSEELLFAPRNGRSGYRWRLEDLMTEISYGTVVLIVVALVILAAAVIVLMVEVGAQQSHIDSLYGHVDFLRAYDNALLTELHSLVHTDFGIPRVA